MDEERPDIWMRIYTWDYRHFDELEQGLLGVQAANPAIGSHYCWPAPTYSGPADNRTSSRHVLRISRGSMPQVFNVSMFVQAAWGMGVLEIYRLGTATGWEGRCVFRAAQRQFRHGYNEL